MENQHRLIDGYRDLTKEEIDAINAIKRKAEDIGCMVEEIKFLSDVDQRWVAIAKTDLQKGFMSLIRAVAKPKTF